MKNTLARMKMFLVSLMQKTADQRQEFNFPSVRNVYNILSQVNHIPWMLYIFTFELHPLKPLPRSARAPPHRVCLRDEVLFHVNTSFVFSTSNWFVSDGYSALLYDANGFGSFGSLNALLCHFITFC